MSSLLNICLKDYFIIFLPFSRFPPYHWYSAVCLWCVSCVFICIYITWGSLSSLDLKSVVFHSFWENLSYYLLSSSLCYSCRTQLIVCLDHFISFHSFWMLLFFVLFYSLRFSVDLFSNSLILSSAVSIVLISLLRNSSCLIACFH